MRTFAKALAFSALATTAAAQSPAMKPFELNMDRVKVVKFGGSFADLKTYFVPTYDLVISAHGSVWAQKGGAQAHGKFFVDGLEKSLLRDLATKLQNDLVTRMRAAGLTVMTYDDLKSESDVSGRGLDKDDEKWGFPIRRGNPLTYIIVAPSPAQQFNNPIQGAAWPFKGIAKSKNLIVVSPEITFSLPQMFGQVRAGYKTNEAGIATDPAMKLEGAVISGVTPKGGTPHIAVLEHGTRLAAESAGTIKKLTENKTEFSKEWNRTSGDFSMTVDPAAFSDGVLRVGFAVNEMIVKQMTK